MTTLALQELPPLETLTEPALPAGSNERLITTDELEQSLAAAGVDIPYVPYFPVDAEHRRTEESQRLDALREQVVIQLKSIALQEKLGGIVNDFHAKTFQEEARGTLFKAQAMPQHVGIFGDKASPATLAPKREKTPFDTKALRAGSLNERAWRAWQTDEGIGPQPSLYRRTAQRLGALVRLPRPRFSE